MKLAFATGNKHKFHEVEKVMKEFEVEIEQIPCDYPEDHSQTVQEIAKEGARYCAEKLQRPVFVDDTGIFFTACDNFPGNAPKKVFEEQGYEGLFKALENKDKSAYFLCVIGYCEPGKEPIIFEGKCNGKITTTINDIGNDVMPYERIFIPDGKEVTNSALSRDEKNKISHRAKAIRALGEFLKNK